MHIISSAASPAAGFILLVESAGRDVACEGWGTLGGEVGTTVSILGSSKSLPFKQTGNDCIIDLSGVQPGEMSAELFVIKLKNAL